jgi:hypothetical protein
MDEYDSKADSHTTIMLQETPHRRQEIALGKNAGGPCALIPRVARAWSMKRGS